MKRFATETARVEAFSDGVFAVIITIMVLELRMPAGTSFAALVKTLPSVGTYALSFVLVGIYWNNHHHMLRASRGIDGRAMWANLNLLFWLSLAPFSTAWLGRNFLVPGPTALYGAILLLAGVAYWLLQRALIAVNGSESKFSKAIELDLKGTLSLALYALSIALAFVYPIASIAIFVIVAITWFIPDRRFEPLIGLE